jgi:hypothetical protein
VLRLLLCVESAAPCLLSCSPFIVRPKPGTDVHECAQIGLLLLSPACPRETSSSLTLPSVQPVGALSSTGRTCSLNSKVDNNDDGDEANGPAADVRGGIGLLAARCSRRRCFQTHDDDDNDDDDNDDESSSTNEM